MKNILFTCAWWSSVIYNSNQLRNKYNILLSDNNNYSYWKYIWLPFFNVPMWTDENYISEIKKIIEKNKIDILVPWADEEIKKINNIAKELWIISIAPNNDFVKLSLNKKNLMNKLKEIWISEIKTYFSEENLKFPLILKPIYWRWSKNVHIVNNINEYNWYFQLYWYDKEDVLIQEYILWEEYTISVIVNNLNKVIWIAPKKVILKKWITRVAISETNDYLYNICSEIVEKLNPCGPFNVQLKLLNWKAYIFEINPRLSTTTVLTDKCFWNEIDLYIENLNKININCTNIMNNDILLIRYDENFFTSN